MQVDFLEKDIEDFIWNEISDGDLFERGLHLNDGVFYRQFELPGAGVMDIVGVSVRKFVDRDGFVHKDICIDVIEIKRGKISCSDVGQLVRYMKYIRENDLEITEQYRLFDYSITINGILVGASIERDALLLMQLSRSFAVVTFEFTLDKGVQFSYASVDDIDFSIRYPSFRDGTFTKIARASDPIKFDLRKHGQIDKGESRSDTNE